MENLAGRMYVFGDNVDTDQIYPGVYLDETDPVLIASHCFKGVRENFAQEFSPGGIVVAGSNFGCGSSREHAVITLKEIGVAAVIANSFARIFYRNGVNIGLPLICAKDVIAIASEGDGMSIDFERLVAQNNRTFATTTIEPVPEFVQKILSYGNVKKMVIANNGL